MLYGNIENCIVPNLNSKNFLKHDHNFITTILVMVIGDNRYFLHNRHELVSQWTYSLNK